MSSAKHYPRAPITEAIIDIRATLPATTEVSVLGRIAVEDEITYPTAEPINTVAGQMVVHPGGTFASTQQQHIGFVFRRNDGLQIYQARLDGFSISQLAPYPTWNDFCSDARRRWTRYCDVAQPITVTRAAVRYINRIDIPGPLGALKDYLRTYPNLSEDLPQTLTGYFMQLVLPLPQHNCQAIITETIVQPAAPEVTSVVLDIDIFREKVLPNEENDLWSFIGQLRHLKNDVFEACITDKARELFQ